MIKSCVAHIRLCFLTGVSGFSQASLFSGLSNLNDINLDQRCAAICGYTEEGLDEVFGPQLEGLDRRQIRALYESIPYKWHTRNEIARYERYYASVFYRYISGLDVDVTLEDSSGRGRLDLAV